jgi:hypothetical protein
MLLSLKDCMTRKQWEALGDLPTTHQNCIEKCGVARPGKTYRDAVNKGKAAQ